MYTPTNDMTAQMRDMLKYRTNSSRLGPFFARPAAHFQMVVEGGHFEHALAVAELEIADLDDVRERLDDVHEAEDDEDERHVVGKDHRRYRASEEERARVSHKDLGGVEVVDEKAQQTARDGRGEDAEGQELSAPDIGQHGEKQADRYACPGGEAVHAVRQVHGVHRADDDEGGKDEIHHFRQGLDHVPEGYVEVSRDIARPAHEEHEGQRRDKLQKELRLGREAQVLLLAELFIVVQKADGAEDQGQRQSRIYGPSRRSSWARSPR